MDASSCVAKEAGLILPNKRLQNSKDFRRHKLHSSPFLFVRYFGSYESLYYCCLQGLGLGVTSLILL